MACYFELFVQDKWLDIALVRHLLLGMGKASWALRSSIVFTVLQAIVLWIGSKHGMYGVLWMMVVFQVAVFLPRWFIPVRHLTRWGLMQYLNVTLKPMLVAAVASLLAFELVQALFDAPLARLSAGLAAIVVLYMVLSLIFNRGWLEEVKALVLFGRSGSPD